MKAATNSANCHVDHGKQSSAGIPSVWNAQMIDASVIPDRPRLMRMAAEIPLFRFRNRLREPESSIGAFATFTVIYFVCLAGDLVGQLRTNSFNRWQALCERGDDGRIKLRSSVLFHQLQTTLQ